MSSARFLFAAVLISAFVTPFLASSINVAIPAMSGEFQVAPTFLSWAVTAFLLGSACMLLPFGRLADIVGRKRLFHTGTVCLILTTIGAGLVPNVGSLFLFRFLQGISTAMIFSTGTALLVASCKPEERGRTIGYSSAAVYSGLTFGPFLGGIITQYFGGRMIFLLVGLLMLTCWLFIRKVKDEWYGDRKCPMDYSGSALYCISSLLLLYGLSAYRTSSVASELIILGLAAGALFLWKQVSSTAPLLHLSLFQNTIFAMSNLAAFLHYSSTFALSFLLSLYLQLVRGLDEVTAGMILLLQPIVMASLSPRAGALSDRLQPRIVASVGMGITAIGILLLSFQEVHTSLFLTGTALLIVGTGFAFFSSPNGNAIMGSVSQNELSIAASVMSITRIFGQSISMALVTLLLQNYVQPESYADYQTSLMHGIQSSLQLFAMLCTLGVGISLMRGKS